MSADIIAAEIRFLRERLKSVLGRHVRKEDQELSDNEFVNVVYSRYHLERAQPLIDPAE